MHRCPIRSANALATMATSSAKRSRRQRRCAPPARCQPAGCRPAPASIAADGDDPSITPGKSADCLKALATMLAKTARRSCAIIANTPRQPPPSMLYRRKALAWQQLDDAIVADQMQRADDDQVVDIGIEQLGNLRQPPAIALGRQQAIQL